MFGFCFRKAAEVARSDPTQKSLRLDHWLVVPPIIHSATFACSEAWKGLQESHLTCVAFQASSFSCMLQRCQFLVSRRFSFSSAMVCHLVTLECFYQCGASCSFCRCRSLEVCE